MNYLNPAELSFLAVFSHEATTPPFTGPATKILHNLGLEYGDISYLSWAYEQEVPRDRFEVGAIATSTPASPWIDREAAIKQNLKIRQVREQRKKELDASRVC